MARRAALTVLVAAALACGPSKEDERLDRNRGICLSFVPGTTTWQEAVNALGGGQGLASGGCIAHLLSTGSGDACSYDLAVCQWDVQFYMNDPGGCSGGPLGGCYYGCVLRVNETDRTSLGNDAPICARFFYDPQGAPYLPPNF
jgi:hypothetical protein